MNPGFASSGLRENLAEANLYVAGGRKLPPNVSPQLQDIRPVFGRGGIHVIDRRDENNLAIACGIIARGGILHPFDSPNQGGITVGERSSAAVLRAECIVRPAGSAARATLLPHLRSRTIATQVLMMDIERAGLNRFHVLAQFFRLKLIEGFVGATGSQGAGVHPGLASWESHA